MNKKVIYMFGMLLAVALLTSCKNGETDFADYEGGVSVYFANQFPIRTLVMGEDMYDTTLDNAHKCQIQATMGGSYSGKDITVQVAVDNSLCDKIFFEPTYNTPIRFMPEDYYTLSGNTMKYDGFRGTIEVQLTDKFFNDPLALDANYVIPLVMTSQTGAQQILTGTPWVEGANPQRSDILSWKVAAQDYVLYCVKYINKYDANYLRRGVDQMTAAGATTTAVRHKGVEKDEVKSDITTLALNKILYPVSLEIAGTRHSCELEITFDANDQVTAIASRTAGVTASGTGSYQAKAEKKAWGNKDRDGLYLDYQLDFGGGVSVATKDTLVWRDRGVKKEEFTPYYQK